MDYLHDVISLIGDCGEDDDVVEGLNEEEEDVLVREYLGIDEKQQQQRHSSSSERQKSGRSRVLSRSKATVQRKQEYQKV